MTDKDPRYPIGKFQFQENYSIEDVHRNIGRIEALPRKLEAAVQHLSEAQLDTPYREGGWTVRQVVHHVADSHINAYVRIKWTMTEATPLIKAYNEKAWAETPETAADPRVSLALLTALHTKWVVLMQALDAIALHRSFTHPDTGKPVPLDRLIALYAWHGEHHLAHITALKERMNW